jgi:hypothetical protein
MSIKKLLRKELFFGGLVSVVFIFMVTGCAAPPKGFDPKIKCPQMIVEPGAISLGVAKLTKTPVVFTARVGTLIKVSEILRARLGSNKKMQNIIVVSQPPISPRTYTARAVSMESDKIAVCKLVVKAPSTGDSFKDWMGVRLGKIVKK